MAKKTSTNAISSLDDDWGKDSANNLPYSGQAVQDFIKRQFGGKCGYLCWSTSVDASNFYHLWGFATKDDATTYMADPEGNAGLLLVNEALPISTVQGDSYGAYLFGDVKSSTDYVVSGSSFTVPLRFCSVRTSNGERLNVNAQGTLVIQRSTDGGSTWTTVETRKGAINSSDYSDTTTFVDVEIGNCLSSGSQKIRIRASFDYEADDGTTKSATSTYVTVGNTITKTSLDLECQQNWQTPIIASEYSSRGFPISYIVYGAVQKTLHVVVTGGSGTDMPEKTYELSADADSYVKTDYIADATDTYKLFKHGVRTVKAWLTCDDGKGGTITSKTLVNRFMVVNPTTDADKTTPYLMLQNMISSADNYAQADICQYAVFSPSVENGSVVNKGAAVPVIFYLTAYAENFPDDNPTEYFRIEENVSPGTQNTLNTTIEIESEDDTQTNIPAYFRIWRKSGDTEVNFLKESIGQNNLVIQVDNSESFAPKSGATFVLNPKTRNNSEASPKTIINAKTGKAVASTWTGFGLVKDGWITSDVDGQRVLRIPAGAKLNFKYNPFAQFLTTADSSCEIEIDFMVRNVTNEDDPIISLFEALSTTDEKGNAVSSYRGLKMCPLHGEIHTKSKYVSSETDFNWREGVRTHVSINIHNAVAPNKNDALVPASSTTLDLTATKIALVRVLINGGIEREFKFSITDNEDFCTGSMSNGGFTLGQSGADLDIYSIRVYQNTAVEANEVLDDYISTLPTTTEKQSMRKQNNILTGGKIDLQKCRALGKRCLVWHGEEPFKENTAAQKGWWEIFQYDKQGNYLPEYSGTLCKETASLETKRQGSTANTYYYSNIQTKMSDVEETITVLLTDLHSSITYEVKDVANDDGTTSKVVSLKGGNLGKNFPVAEKAEDYEYAEVDGQAAVVVPDGWVDGNGKYRGIGYIVAEGTPMAQKLVNKINYASSMQSHLTGVNNLYNDLHKAIVGKNSLQEAYSEARVSKYTEPFLYFTQAFDSDTPVYRGPCTFGAGKMDKPTWGYVKKLHPMFTMIEGSDNNYDLTDMRVPFTWGDADCPENITYQGGDYEGFFYNGKQCLDFDAGATQKDAQETPTEELIARIAEVWNFLYLHSPMVQYYKGTFEAFQQSDAAKNNVFNKYWCTDGTEAYRLKRYDYVNEKWVDAGLWNSTTKAWEVIDLRTHEITKATYDASSNQSEYAALNVEFRTAIVDHCKKYVGFYFREDSLKLYYAFIIHLLAGTDSCSKNTYFVLDPKAVSVTIDGETRECYLFEMHTDDVDTMLPIDNNGRSTKPYYIDRMHPYVDGDTSTEKYEGMHNVLFNLCEEMYEYRADTDGKTELQKMLRRIFTAMEGLVSSTDYIEGFPSTGIKVSVMGCLWKYIYYVHKYIPTVAFNEAARIRYEYPEMIGFVSYGSGARGVRPITQSNGSLLECELQFIERRLVLMGSFAAWGPFFDGKDHSIGIADATEAFSMQAFHLPDSATSVNTYQFNVTPHQYIYPTGMMGQTSIDPHTRVAPGETFTLNLGTTSSNDTGMSIMGINYYRSIGNVGDLSTPSQTITVNGKRLTEFVAEPSKYYTDMDSGSSVPAFRPGAIEISAKSIQKLSLKGCTGTSGAVDCSNLSRLQSVDARQTRLTDITLPETHTLTSVQLPATITAVNVTNQTNLSTLTLEGYSNLTRFVVLNNSLIDTYTLANAIYAARPQGLKTVSVGGISWKADNNRRTKMDVLMYLCGLGASLQGTIQTVDYRSDRRMTLADKQSLVAMYGDIDSDSNAAASLRVIYDIIAVNSIRITGETFMTTAGKDYQFTLTPTPVSGNNIAVKDGRLDMAFSLPAEVTDGDSPIATWNDSNTGSLHVNRLYGADSDTKYTMTATATTMATSSAAAQTLTAEKKVGFYRHIPKVGDFVYADGTTGSDWDTARDLVGIVFMREPVYGSDGTTVTGYKVHVCADADLSFASDASDDGDAVTWSSHRWGIYPDSTNVNGFGDETETAAVAAAKDAGYDLTAVFDIPGLSNLAWNNHWGGVNEYDNGLHMPTEKATATVLADTPAKDYAAYEATWKAYYAALATLYAALQTAYKTAYPDSATEYTYSESNRAESDDIYTIASSGTIAATSKETLTQAWVRARSCYNALTSAALTYGISSSGEYATFKTAFQAVADMLNNGEDYTTVSDETAAPAWIGGAVNYTYLTDYTYLDDDQDDGYKAFPASPVCAASDFDGAGHTAKIVEHAKIIVGTYLPKVDASAGELPGTLKELANAMAQVRNDNADATNPWRYEEFYYPAAYGCSLYEPSSASLDKEVFGSGKWYLPAEGEVMRLYNFYRQGVTTDKADDSPMSEARTPIFANANARIGSNRLKWSGWGWWSSSEPSAYNSWLVNFGSGYVNYSNKCNYQQVRPCTAFSFSL